MEQSTGSATLLEAHDPEADGPEETVDEHRRNLVLRVFSPRHPDPKPFRFDLDITVGAAASKASEAFGYDGGTPTFKRKDRTVLDRMITLRAAGLRHREEVELVDVGGGV